MPYLSRNALRHLAVPLLLVVTAAVFWPAVYGGFIFDDYPIFAENSAIHVTGWHWAEWQRVWSWAHTNIQRPLAMLSYAFNYALGNDAFGFKVTNLCIHLLNTLLVLLFIKRLLRATWFQKVQDSSLNERHANYWALGIAAAWALHPLQVSTVMYVVQRMELLGFTFTLLALLAYWRARQQQIKGLHGWPWLSLCGLLTAIGYGTKETVLLVPGYMLLLELVVLRFAAAQTYVTHVWRGLFAIGCTLAVVIVVFYLLPRYSNAYAFAGRDYDAWQRELSQLRALPMYIGWSLAPLPSHLQFYYDNYTPSTDLLHPVTTLWGGLFLLGLAAVAILMRHRRPLIAFGIGWFFVAHALTSAPLPLELVFEHRNYPALLGIVLVLADVLLWISQRLKSQVPVLLGLVLIANLCFLTTLRSLVWSSPFQLAVTLADYNQGSLRAAMDLARRFMAMSGGNPDSPLYSLCIKELERATRLPMDSPLPEEALLLIAAEHTDMPTKPLWDSFEQKLQNRPMVPDTYQVLHTLMNYRVNGTTTIDAQRLAQLYAIAAARNPTRQSLQVDYAELSGAALHDPDLAIAHWGIALKLDSNIADYGPRLASYLVSQKRYKEAIGVIEKTFELSASAKGSATLLALKDTASHGLQQEAPPSAKSTAVQ